MELVAEGEEQTLKDFMLWCYNGVGPATVQTIEDTWADSTGKYNDFVIKF